MTNKTIAKSLNISEKLLKASQEAKELTAEDIKRMAEEAEELAQELGVDIPEILNDSDSEAEKARKIAKNASITAGMIIEKK
jgi:hypothetical protein